MTFGFQGKSFLYVGKTELRNADPIWLHQNEMWEYMTDEEESWIPNMAVA